MQTQNSRSQIYLLLWYPNTIPNKLSLSFVFGCINWKVPLYSKWLNISLLSVTTVFLWTDVKLTQFIKSQSCHHIEISQLICRANLLTGFCMMGTLAFNELSSSFPIPIFKIFIPGLSRNVIKVSVISFEALFYPSLHLLVQSQQLKQQKTISVKLFKINY